MRKIIAGKLVITLAVICVLGACVNSGAVEIGDKAPEFTLQDINGKTVNMYDFGGKVIILNFFANWCPPCRQEIPDFIELQKQYSGKAFTMIGVNLVGPDESKSFADEYGINYPVLIDEGKASVIYGPVRSIPTTFVIAKDGRIVKKYIGSRPKEVFEKDVRELLK